MLNIKLPDNIHKGMRDLIHTLSIGHVSKYPIDVVVRPLDQIKNVVTDVYFLDSRFPVVDDDWSLDKVTACFWASSAGTFVVKSKRIRNDKYSSFSDGYHTRKTVDPKKMLRILKEYVSPFTDFEIAKRTEDISRPLENWKYAAREKLHSMMGDISGRELMSEIMYLKSIGVEFRSKVFQDVAKEGANLQNESNRRESFANNALSVYVYEQPDGTVSLMYLGDTRGPTYKRAASATYENIEAVPEIVRQQMALLKMTDADVYVPEVGKRDAQNGYWLHLPKSESTFLQGGEGT